MTTDWGWFGFTYDSHDSSTVLKEYIEHVANKKLLIYKSIIHTGGKVGESLWAHILNLVTIIEQLRTTFALNGNEMRCLFLALTVHDINKLNEYGKLSSGRDAKYSVAAKMEHLRAELKALEIEYFFPQWEEYIYDIKYLADAHQEKSPQNSSHDQVHVEQCKLDEERLEGPLYHLMKVADVSDNSHSGEYLARDEKHIRDKLSFHVNAALSSIAHRRRYRLVGHRLAELRGLLTNGIHNELVSFLIETYGKEACIDVLYHPEGVDYLLDTKVSFAWSAQERRQLAQRIGQKFAQMQADRLTEFIKAKPSGITVGAEALESGAPIAIILDCVTNTVRRKQYKAEWREERNALVRGDLTGFLHRPDVDEALKEQVLRVLETADLVSPDPVVLKRGEFVMAYRNFLKDHRDEQLKAVKQDAWERAYRLFHLPEISDALYRLTDPYRRAYFLARDLPTLSLDEMQEVALADLESLAEQAAAQTQRKGKATHVLASSEDEHPEEAAQPFDSTFLVDYLERNLQMWDSQPNALLQPHAVNFRDTLRRYTDSSRPDRQCCYCGSALQAEEWMAVQVPTSIGVQSFSNRLEGGSAREPKRNVCAVCRTQFILEKLAWEAHRDKQGKELATFYLHLFPYSCFTAPLLHAWWQSIKQVREVENATSLLLDTQDYLLQWHDHPEYFESWQADYLSFQEKIRYTARRQEGLGIPLYSEAVSNTPVLPLIASGTTGSLQFLFALEKTVVLTRWFDCRLLLSRLPTPLLNLANEKLGDEPVALLVESVPSSMNWLLPHNALTREGVKQLCQRLGALHAIARELVADEDHLRLIYDLVTAAAADPLALYHEVDRLIERKAAQKKGGKTEYQAMNHTKIVAPLLERLLD